LARQIANTAGHENHRPRHVHSHQHRHYYYRGVIAGRIKLLYIYRKPAFSGFFRFGLREIAAKTLISNRENRFA
jgi:hypothetical protein